MSGHPPSCGHTYPHGHTPRRATVTTAALAAMALVATALAATALAATAMLTPASAVVTDSAPPAAIQVAAARARAVFHTGVVRADFSLRSRRDPSWALVDGGATARPRLWAAWLHRNADGVWELRYFVTSAPFAPGTATHGRVPCDLSPAFSEPRCHRGPSDLEIRARLARQLLPTGDAARIGRLLTNGGYRFAFTAPVNGSVRLDWRTAPTPGAAPALVARATGDFLIRRTGTLHLTLTPRGRTLLAASRRLRLTARITLTPILYADVSARRSFTLRR